MFLTSPIGKVFLRVGNDHNPAIRILELVVATGHLDQFEHFFCLPFYDLLAVHSLIIHTIHTHVKIWHGGSIWVHILNSNEHDQLILIENNYWPLSM